MLSDSEDWHILNCIFHMSWGSCNRAASVSSARISGLESWRYVWMQTVNKHVNYLCETKCHIPSKFMHQCKHNYTYSCFGQEIRTTKTSTVSKTTCSLVVSVQFLVENIFISKYNDSQFQCIEAKRALKAVHKKDGGQQPDSDRAKC